MGNYVHTKGRIWKNFEAEGRIDWKSKKKAYTSAYILFLLLKIGEKQKKKVYTAADVLFLPLKIREEQGKKVYTSADVLFLPLNIGEEQKKDSRGRTCHVFH